MKQYFKTINEVGNMLIKQKSILVDLVLISNDRIERIEIKKYSKIFKFIIKKIFTVL